MFILFGTTVKSRVLAVVVFACRFCDKTVPHQVEEHATKATLFFVPLVTLRKRWLDRCSNCGGLTELSREQADHAVAQSAARD
jgi:hypothetical protein